MTVTIGGLNFTGVTASGVNFGAGITVNSMTVNSDSQITANMAISTVAGTGYRNLSVTNEAGTGTLSNAFNVAAPSGGGGGGGGGGGTTVDTTPPVITSTNPVNNASGVAINTPVTATFSETLNASTVTSGTFSLKQTQGGTAVQGTVSYVNNVATFTLSANLAYNTGYTATVTTGVTDVAGNHLATDDTWSFTTAVDTTPPTVHSTSPASNASGVAINIPVKATFSKALDASTVNTTTFTLIQTEGGTAVQGSVTCANNIATFTPSANLANDTDYTATITTGVTDLLGNPLAADYTWSFTTIAQGTDTTPPIVSSTSPASNATGVAINAPVTATFSEALNASTVNTTTFSLKQTQGGTAAQGTVTYANKVATFTPSAALDYNTSYTATITTALTDVAANHMATDYTWSFTTIAQTTDTTPPTVSSISPANNASGVATGIPVKATFSEALNASTITEATFTLTQTQGGTAVPGRVTCTNNIATFTPSASLAFSTRYTATITSGAGGVKDLAGNPLATDYTWSFTTMPQTSAVAVSLSAPDTVTWNDTFEVSVNIASVTNLYTFQFSITYNPDVLQVTGNPGDTKGVTAGLIGPSTAVVLWNYYPATNPPPPEMISVDGHFLNPATGSGNLATIHFRVISHQSQPLDLTFTNRPGLINNLFKQDETTFTVAWTGTTVNITGS